MNPETASLLSLGEYDEELQKKIITDVERIIAAYLTRNVHELSSQFINHEQATIEHFALRALRQNFFNASNSY